LTLIAGIKLPRGILLVSDTRETVDRADIVVSDSKRKIVFVTRGFLIASSGHSNTDHIANILRSSLYNRALNVGLTRDYVRNTTLSLFSKVNEIHQPNHPYGDPVGITIIGEYDQDNDDFNLLCTGGLAGFNEFHVLNTVKDLVLIGATAEIQQNVKARITALLDSLSQDFLHKPGLYKAIAEECQKYFQYETKNYVGVGDRLYCTYLTEMNKTPAHDVYILEKDGTRIPVDMLDSSDYFKELDQTNS